MRIRLDIPLKLSCISSFMKANKLTESDPVVNYICTDSRELQSGDLFFAIKGENYDGIIFIEEAIKKGAFTVSKSDMFTHLQVKDTRRALLSLAKEYKKLLSAKKIVAITGSVGKTTTKELLYHLISTKYKAHKTSDNQNNELGVSYTILSAPQNTEILIVETGMNNMGELSLLSECVEPDIAIITKIGSAHIGNLGSREMIAKSKLQITDHLKNDGVTLVPHGEKLLESAPGRISVSTTYNDADFFLKKTEDLYQFTSKKQYIKGIFPKVIGEHIPECLAFALAASEVIGLTESDLIESINNIPQNVSRAKLIKIGTVNIYDDSYNSSPEAVEYALSTLLKLNFKFKSALLGDINELGSKTEEFHYKLGQLCYHYGVNNLFVYGVYSEFIAKGATDAGFDEKRIYKNSDTTQPIITARQILSVCSPNEVILFKASHKTALKNIIELLVSISNSKI